MINRNNALPLILAGAIVLVGIDGYLRHKGHYLFPVFRPQAEEVVPSQSIQDVDFYIEDMPVPTYQAHPWTTNSYDSTINTNKAILGPEDKAIPSDADPPLPKEDKPLEKRIRQDPLDLSAHSSICSVGEILHIYSGFYS